MRTPRWFVAALVATGCGRVVFDGSAEDAPLPSISPTSAPEFGTGGSGEGGAPVDSTSSATSSTAAPASVGAGGAPTDPTLIASGLTMPAMIVLVGDDIYITESGTEKDSGSLARVPKTGGAVERLVTEQDVPWAIGHRDGFVVWTNFGTGPTDGKVQRWGVADDAVTPLAQGLGHPWSFTFHGDSVIFIDGESLTLQKSGADLTVAPLLTEQDWYTPLASDGSRIYFASHEEVPPSTIVHSLAADGTVTDLYAGLNLLDALVVDGSDLYFATVDGTLRRGSVEGADATVLTTGQSMVYALAVSDGYVYFANTDAGYVARVSTFGGPTEILAASQGGPAGIAVDSEAVYWADMYSGEIHRMPK